MSYHYLSDASIYPTPVAAVGFNIATAVEVLAGDIINIHTFLQFTQNLYIDNMSHHYSKHPSGGGGL